MATGRSFKETLVGKDVGKSVEEIVIDDGLIGNTHWNGLGLIGTTKGMKELTGLKDWLMSVRLANVGIRYVGGLSVVLVFEEKERMAEFFSTKEVWNLVFDSLGIWEGQRLQVGRIAWLKCFGVPLCLFDTRVMDSIGSKFGRVVQSVQIDDSIEDYSYAMIGVLHSSGNRVNQECKLKWRNETFSVIVEEELGDWFPDCIGGYGDESMEVVSVENVPGKEMGEGVANVEVEAEILEDYVGPVNGHLVEEVGIELNGTRTRTEGYLGTVYGLSIDMPVGNDVNGGKKEAKEFFEEEIQV
ncbi:hypothetical protein Hdeb2414_s0074g00775201 [Helianthus debilis subsp. tardiflorus]